MVKTSLLTIISGILLVLMVVLVFVGQKGCILENEKVIPPVEDNSDIKEKTITNDMILKKVREIFTQRMGRDVGEYPINLQEINHPHLVGLFPSYRFVQAQAGVTLPPKYIIIATGKGKVYGMPEEFNSLLVDNEIKISKDNLIDIAKTFALVASPKEILHISFTDQALIDETEKGVRYQARLITWSKINGIEEEWKFSINNHQFETVMVKTLRVGVGEYVQDIEGPSPAADSVRFYFLKLIE